MNNWEETIKRMQETKEQLTMPYKEFEKLRESIRYTQSIRSNVPDFYFTNAIQNQLMIQSIKNTSSVAAYNQSIKTIRMLKDNLPNFNSDSLNQLYVILYSDKFKRSLEQWKEKQKIQQEKQESQDITSNDSGAAAETVMINKLNDPQATEELIEEIISDSQKLDMKEWFNKYVYILNIICLLLNIVIYPASTKTSIDLYRQIVQEYGAGLDGTDKLYYIYKDSANVYQEPDVHSKIEGVLYYGNLIRETESTDLWIMIEYQEKDGEMKTGWIEKRCMVSYDAIHYEPEELPHEN